MKRSGDVRNSAQAALAAAERTFQRSGPLPFETTPPGDPLQAGRQRLKGAFLIDVTRIRPDPKQPRRERRGVEGTDDLGVGTGPEATAAGLVRRQ